MYFGPALVIIVIRTLFWLVLLVGIGFLAVAAVRSWGAANMRVPPAVGSRDGALAILDERYARGEISREDYLQMRKDLTGGGQ